MIDHHQLYMQHCINLAQKGLGHVSPNPLVGSVIVLHDKVIAEGFHSKFGEEHAEPSAIKKADESLLKDSTLYVNLEPCSHHGKTPPCADLIIRKGIKKVVVGNMDPNPLVAGKGIEKLKNAGVEVITGVLENECAELNKRFFTFHQKKRPYIILKWAQTKDNFISKLPLPAKNEDNWISGEESKTLVHQWRTEEQAILIGYHTVIADNPKLSARLFAGNNPIRIVIDRVMDLKMHYHVFNDEAKTVVFNGVKDQTIRNVQWIKIDFTNFIEEILNQLYLLNINSILVEGGARTLEHFINTNFWDEARIFVNPKLYFNRGIEAPHLDFKDSIVEQIGEDKLYIFKNAFQNSSHQ